VFREAGKEAEAKRGQIEAALAEAINSHAEGVETEAQRDMLRQLQCEEMQGFLFSAAKTASEIKRMFSTCQPRATG
jgi:EAL domain-containing protein (putative c-di-GMP-specific phosphodiesterase class I)